MTLLHKPVRRSTATTVHDQGKHRRLVVTLYPGDVIGLRPEKTRREEFTSLAAVYSLAVKQRVARQRAERAQRRRGKRARQRGGITQRRSTAV